MGRYEYDAAGRQTKVTDRLGNVTTFTYDGNGNRTSMLDGRGQLYRYEYDASNHQTEDHLPGWFDATHPPITPSDR